MNKIGLFYGSETGNTESAANRIAEKLEADLVDLHNIENAKKEEMEQYDNLIMGIPTWYVGEMPGAWENFFPILDDIDFTGKKVALFGLGDQSGYGENYLDAMGVLFDKLTEQGATIIGHWSTEGYDYVESKAVRNGKFVGLALDEDNQDYLTDDRIEKWVEMIKAEFLLPTE
jgi:flavodoxin I